MSTGIPVTQQSDSLILVKEKIGQLEQALLERHPRMPFLLEEIHKTLKAQPENVTLLDEEDIQKLVKGLERQTNTYMAEVMVAKKPSSKSIQSKIAALGEDAF